MKTLLAKEVDKFFESKEGLTLCQGTASGQYLRNRIHRAFMAGVAVGKRLYSQEEK